LIAWWNVLLPAIGLSSPQAANGGGPKGQALQTDGGEQTIELAIGHAHNVGSGASGTSPWRQLFSICAHASKPLT